MNIDELIEKYEKSIKYHKSDFCISLGDINNDTLIRYFDEFLSDIKSLKEESNPSEIIVSGIIKQLTDSNNSLFYKVKELEKCSIKLNESKDSDFYRALSAEIEASLKHNMILMDDVEKLKTISEYDARKAIKNYYKIIDMFRVQGEKMHLFDIDKCGWLSFSICGLQLHKFTEYGGVLFEILTPDEIGETLTLKQLKIIAGES